MLKIVYLPRIIYNYLCTYKITRPSFGEENVETSKRPMTTVRPHNYISVPKYFTFRSCRYSCWTPTPKTRKFILKI